MKILLIGEYSGVHTELSKALKNMGHEVKTISDGDEYKCFPADILIRDPSLKWKNNKINTFFRMFLEYSGLKGICKFLFIWNSIKREMIGYDVVQLINPLALSAFGSIANLYLLRYLRRKNSKIFLKAVGDDYYDVIYSMKQNTKFTYLKNIHLKDFVTKYYSLKYVYGLFYKKLNDYAIDISTKVIPGLYDYKMEYDWCDKSTNIIPLSVIQDKLGSPINIHPNEKIVIFNGWQKGKELKKGNDIFDRAANRVLREFPDKVEYVIVQSVPFEEYIKLYASAHIFFDQCYSYDKGVNGMLGMAAGKVVFSGFEKEALECYPHNDFTKEYGINALPDEEYIYKCLIALIENPQRIETISKNAIEFVMKNHLSNIVAEKYIQIWSENSNSFFNS